MFLVDWSKAYHLGYLYLIDQFHLVRTIVNVRKLYRLYFALYFIKVLLEWLLEYFTRIQLAK